MFIWEFFSLASWYSMKASWSSIKASGYSTKSNWAFHNSFLVQLGRELNLFFFQRVPLDLRFLGLFGFKGTLPILARLPLPSVLCVLLKSKVGKGVFSMILVIFYDTFKSHAILMFSRFGTMQKRFIAVKSCI